jgi:hypothetical protein
MPDGSMPRNAMPMKMSDSTWRRRCRAACTAAAPARSAR